MLMHLILTHLMYTQLMLEQWEISYSDVNNLILKRFFSKFLYIYIQQTKIKNLCYSESSSY
jgi:hypothetical protein